MINAKIKASLQMQFILYKTNQGYLYNKQLANSTMTNSSNLLT